MSLCMTCGGFIVEANKAYGYAGKFCHCATPRSPLADIIDKHRPLGLGDVKIHTPAPMPLAAPTAMSAADFVMWLRGYLAAKNDEPAFGAVVAKLTTVAGPK